MLIIAIIGGRCCLKLKVPAGALIGAMLSVVLLNTVTGRNVEFPTYARFFTQVATGAFIGAKIRKSDIYALKDIIFPIFTLTVCMLGFGAVTGGLLARYTKLDLSTALFAAAPAGVTDMTLASISFNADSAKVALLQMVRLISVLSVMPSLIKLICKRFAHFAPPVKRDSDLGFIYHGNYLDVSKTLIVGLVLGSLGHISGFPAGVISFSMIGCAIYNIAWEHAYMPLRLRQFIQYFAGAYIGGMITRTHVFELLAMYETVIAIIFSFFALNFIIAFLLVRICKLDLVTALFSSTAGGLTDMALIADELGADRAKVAAMQLIRVVGVIAFYPPLIKILTGAR